MAKNDKDIFSKDVKILEKYSVERHIDSYDSQHIDELANAGLIHKKLSLSSFQMKAETSQLGKDLLKATRKKSGLQQLCFPLFLICVTVCISSSVVATVISGSPVGNPVATVTGIGAVVALIGMILP